MGRFIQISASRAITRSLNTMIWTYWSLGVLGLMWTSWALSPITINGPHFINSKSKTRMRIMGVDYQPGGQAAYMPTNKMDPLSNETICTRDANLLQTIGINTIRVYNVDPQIDHSACATIFNNAGIYMLIDVNSPLPGESLDRLNPANSYNAHYLSHTFRVVENFKNFPNLLGFFATNEVINDHDTAMINPPFIRVSSILYPVQYPFLTLNQALQRDLKMYISKHANRQIPVGYSAADVRELLHDMWQYSQCSLDPNNISNADFFGLNSYSWCGDNTSFEQSGYDQLLKVFQNTTIPVFFSEFGCNVIRPRPFNEIAAIFSPQMDLFSGGLVYEYSQESSDYGLVDILPDGNVHLRPDFTNLANQIKRLNFTEISHRDIQSINSQRSKSPSSPPTNAVTAPMCSPSLIKSSRFSRHFNLIPPSPEIQRLIDRGVSKPVIGRLLPPSSSLPRNRFQYFSETWNTLPVELSPSPSPSPPPSTLPFTSTLRAFPAGFPLIQAHSVSALASMSTPSNSSFEYPSISKLTTNVRPNNRTNSPPHSAKRSVASLHKFPVSFNSGIALLVLFWAGYYSI